MVRRKDRTPGPGAYHIDPHYPLTSPTPPAYTIAAKTLTPFISSSDQAWNPGPGSYPITSKRSGPAFTMQGRKPTPFDHPLHPHSSSACSIPGPGAYFSAKLSLTHAKDPAYTISGRGRAFAKDSFPGPGAYALRAAETGPAFTIPARGPQSAGRASKISDTTPGPGLYSLEERRSSAPAFTIGKKQTTREELEDNSPGPGAYLIHGASSCCGPAYTISRRKPPTEIDESPGPGEYYLDAGAPVTSRKEPAFTIGARPKGKVGGVLSKPGPGPGEYSLPVDRGPCYSMGGRWRSPKRSCDPPSPGPGSYNALKSDSKVGFGAPAYTIAARHPAQIVDDESLPGPGAYDPVAGDAMGDSGHCLAFSGRKPSEKVWECPGPCEYNAEGAAKKSVLSAAPAISIGRKLRKKAAEDAPGPGTYALLSSTCREGPAFTITSTSDRAEGF